MPFADPAVTDVRDIREHPPRRVAALAWSFIIAGLVKLIGLPLFVWALLDEGRFLFSDANASVLSPAWLARVARLVVDHLPYFVAFWMLLGLFMIVAAGNLLRRRRWARLGLEAVCWFGILEASLVAAFIESVRRMLLRGSEAGGDLLASSLVSRFWVSLSWLGIYVILLVLLKRAGQGDRLPVRPV
jgi:hypothetical protein